MLMLSSPVLHPSASETWRHEMRGEVCRARRLRVGLSQDALARLCGISYDTLCMYERAHRPFSHERHLRLDAVLSAYEQAFEKVRAFQWAAA
jgi:transcriptional regulator with XRE-family HTH domain